MSDKNIAWVKDLADRFDEIKVKPSDPIYAYDCLKCGGRCCIGVDVWVNPHDIWRIVHGAEAKQLGIRLSHDLFSDADHEPHLRYFLGSSGSPMAVLNIKAGKPCPFLAPALKITSDEDAKVMAEALGSRARFVKAFKKLALKAGDGSAAGLCTLESSKPTICRAYPLGRMGHCELKDGKPGCPKMEFINAESKRCKQFRKEKPTTVAEYVKKWGLDESYRESDRIFEWIDKMREVPEQVRFVLGLMAYDFDLPGIVAVCSLKPGMPPPEKLTEKQVEAVIKLRPNSFDKMLDAQLGGMAKVKATVAALEEMKNAKA